MRPPRKNKSDQNNGERDQHPILTGYAEGREIRYKPVAHRNPVNASLHLGADTGLTAPRSDSATVHVKFDHCFSSESALPVWDSRTRWSNLLPAMTRPPWCLAAKRPRSPHMLSAGGCQRVGFQRTTGMLLVFLRHGSVAALALIVLPWKLNDRAPDAGLLLRRDARDVENRSRQRSQ